MQAIRRVLKLYSPAFLANEFCAAGVASYDGPIGVKDNRAPARWKSLVIDNLLEGGTGDDDRNHVTELPFGVENGYFDAGDPFVRDARLAEAGDMNLASRQRRINRITRDWSMLRTRRNQRVY